MDESKMILRIQDDGTIKVDSSKVKGSAEQILKMLNDLTAEVGGDLEIEKHVEGQHHHHHGDVKGHTHN